MKLNKFYSLPHSHIFAAMSKHIPKYFLQGVIIFLSALFVLETNAQNPVKRDTAVAQVVYGSTYLFNGIDTLNLSQLVHLQDSLKTLDQPPKELISQIDLYVQIKTMAFGDVYEVIDSLFELDTVPYPLINELNKYLANQQNNTLVISEEEIDTSQYPAEYYYPNWNTVQPNPYNTNSMGNNDSTLVLTLVGTSKSPTFVMPVNNVLTSSYGWRDGRMHKGIDIDVQVWDTVVSAFSGMVRVARTYGGYGRVVVIRHFNGLETLYAHLHRIKVKPGQVVGAGDLIGLGGSSGNSTGSHLHWEIRFKGSPLNPLVFIDYKKQELIANKLVLRKTKHGYTGYPEGSVFYTVQNGDYLYKIAANYGTTVSKICELNSIRRNSNLWVGQKIRVI